MEDNSRVLENKKRNEKYLKEFENLLKEEGLSKEAIKTHLKNVDLYINKYLNYYDVVKMEDGIISVNPFLIGWFIEKEDVTKDYLKEMVESIRKFYQCMNKLGYVTKENYNFLCNITRDNLDFYLKLVDAYNSGTYYEIF